MSNVFRQHNGHLLADAASLQVSRIASNHALSTTPRLHGSLRLALHGQSKGTGIRDQKSSDTLSSGTALRFPSRGRGSSSAYDETARYGTKISYLYCKRAFQDPARQEPSSTNQGV